ncbi:TetR/AcrR family transcriptional regulator [Aquabacter cavernae]|uniref:TetR/AcrR family transcriptional regulator n=1 Tax=Aquabacter cavernae TaxID=2496029 RepID=UPI000F8DF035|nr:TetR/AcrR family transcriptional regulator [Aquabacter cavernae]
MGAPSTTADTILSCAHTLLMAGGYNGFSYADISKVVGIRNASIHHHFPSKVDLVRTLVVRYREAAIEGLAQLERSVPAPADQLRAYVGYWQACIADGSAPFCINALLASQAPVLPEDIVREVRAHFQVVSSWLAEVLRRGAAAGALTLRDTPEVEAEILLSAVHGAMLSARAYGKPETYPLILRPLLDRLTSKG